MLSSFLIRNDQDTEAMSKAQAIEDLHSRLKNNVETIQQLNQQVRCKWRLDSVLPQYASDSFWIHMFRAQISFRPLPVSFFFFLSRIQLRYDLQINILTSASWHAVKVLWIHEHSLVTSLIDAKKYSQSEHEKSPSLCKIVSWSCYFESLLSIRVLLQKLSTVTVYRLFTLDFTLKENC